MILVPATMMIRGMDMAVDIRLHLLHSTAMTAIMRQCMNGITRRCEVVFRLQYSAGLCQNFTALH